MVSFVKWKHSVVNYTNSILRYDPDDTEPFEILNLLLKCGGALRGTKNSGLRKWWWFSHILGFCQYVILMIQTLSFAGDYVSNVWYFSFGMTFTLCLLKQGFLLWYDTEIEEMKQFITLREYSSGNQEFDLTTRMKFFESVRSMVLAVFALTVCDQLIIYVPNEHRDHFYAVPELICSWGPNVTLAVKVVYFSLQGVIWIPKYFSPPAMAASLTLGLRAELEIVAHSYERIFSEALSVADEQLQETNLRGWELVNGRNDLFWVYAQNHLGKVIDRHTELLSQLDTLQSIFEKLFCLKYYYALAYVGSVLFIAINEDFSLYIVIIISCILGYTLEVYWFCSLAASFQDIIDRIETSIHDLYVPLEHTHLTHPGYKRIGKSLSIVNRNACRIGRFSCLGIFEISLEAFLEFSKTSYTMLTFLSNMKH